MLGPLLGQNNRKLTMYDFIQIALVIAHWIVQLIQPVLVPICFVAAWSIVILGLWGVWAAIRDSVQRAQQMHQIPCSQCRYFSGNYLLKCPVHPSEALSEAAIDCMDFEKTGIHWQLTSSARKQS